MHLNELHLAIFEVKSEYLVCDPIFHLNNLKIPFDSLNVTGKTKVIFMKE